MPRLTNNSLKGLSHADLAKKHTILCMIFFGFMYDFSVALISALALLKFSTRSAQRMHLLEHMFQMTAVAPQTPDLYLWGFLKDHVYENRSSSIHC